MGYHLNEFHQTAIERGIWIKFEKRYSHIVSEDDCGVEFAFADGSTEKASMLIGADRVYSEVRSYVAPAVTPIYSGFIAITYAVKRSNLRIPPRKSSHLPWRG